MNKLTLPRPRGQNECQQKFIKKRIGAPTVVSSMRPLLEYQWPSFTELLSVFGGQQHPCSCLSSSHLRVQPRQVSLVLAIHVWASFPSIVSSLMLMGVWTCIKWTCRLTYLRPRKGGTRYSTLCNLSSRCPLFAGLEARKVLWTMVNSFSGRRARSGARIANCTQKGKVIAQKGSIITHNDCKPFSVLSSTHSELVDKLSLLDKSSSVSQHHGPATFLPGIHPDDSSRIQWTRYCCRYPPCDSLDVCLMRVTKEEMLSNSNNLDCTCSVTIPAPRI